MATKEKTARETAVANRQPADFTDQLIEPFNQLRSEVDRLFEGFPFRMPSLRLGRLAATAPAIEMSETDKNYKVTAELPGMDPDNVEVSFEDGALRIAGEKKVEREETERGYRFSERSYGSFERMIPLPAAADPEKISARFKNGVLTVTVAKNGQKRNARAIRIDKEA
jgi:HSP20 family protein